MGNYDNVSDTLKQFDFFKEMTAFVRCSRPQDLVPNVLNRPAVLKSYLSSWLSKSCFYLCEQGEIIDSLRESVNQLITENEQLTGEVNQLKTATIQSQNTVIKLQEDLLMCKEEQLKSVRSVVESAVQDSVKTEIQSYSEAVKKTTPVMTMKSVKTAVKQANVEEDRSRSIMVFGLKEEPNEQLSQKMDNFLLHFGEKPRHESTRIGMKTKGDNPRPVKIRLSSSVHVHRILKLAKTLKDSESYSSVFIAPDRTPEERATRRDTVAALRKKVLDEPLKHHYIRKGVLISSND